MIDRRTDYTGPANSSLNEAWDLAREAHEYESAEYTGDHEGKAVHAQTMALIGIGQAIVALAEIIKAAHS
jgi:hypothetical protein